MDLNALKELGKALLWLIIGIFMFPMLIILDWGWNRWANLWKESVASSMLFVLFAPFMLFCFAIAWLFARPWQKMLTG